MTELFSQLNVILIVIIIVIIITIITITIFISYITSAICVNPGCLWVGSLGTRPEI